MAVVSAEVRGQLDVNGCGICGREFEMGDQVVLTASKRRATCSAHWDGTEYRAKWIEGRANEGQLEEYVNRMERRYARWVKEGKTATIQ